MLADERTDAIVFEKGFLHLADIPMMQPLQDADLSRKRHLITTDSGSGALDLVFFNDLDGIPLARRTRHGLHDCRK